MKAINRSFTNKGVKLPNGLTIISGMVGSGKTKFQQFLVNEMKNNFKFKIFLQETTSSTFLKAFIKDPILNVDLNCIETRNLGLISEYILEDVGNNIKNVIYFIESIDMLEFPTGQNAHTTAVYLSTLASKHNISIVMSAQSVRTNLMNNDYPDLIGTSHLADLFIALERLNTKLDSKFISFIKRLFFIKETANFKIHILKNRNGDTGIIKSAFNFEKIKLKLL